MQGRRSVCLLDGLEPLGVVPAAFRNRWIRQRLTDADCWCYALRGGWRELRRFAAATPAIADRVLSVSNCLLSFPLDLLSCASDLLLFVASPLTSLSLSAPAYVSDLAFYSVLIHYVLP
jgi:hypothetical protein